MDLSKIPFEEIKKEYFKRLELIKLEKKKEKQKAVYCKNCAHRMWGRIYMNGMSNRETWVCEMKPKEAPTLKYAKNIPSYMKAYRKSYPYGGSDCKMFINAYSEEGKEIIKKRGAIANYMSDEDMFLL